MSVVRLHSEAPYAITVFAGVAQLAEQLICNQQVAGSSPITSSSEIIMDGFPSGQRERTVNPLSQTTMVRIHPHPPIFSREWRNWQTRTVQVRVRVTSCRFKSCFPHQRGLHVIEAFSLFITIIKAISLMISGGYKDIL